MPEGDTLARIAVALRPYLAGRVVSAARARLPGPQVSRIVGQKIDAVDAAGKNLLIKFDGGLELRTHLGLHGSWHRYRPGETWRRPPSRAALVIEVPGAIAVCFDAPVVELFERRAEVVHPTISMLGPDLAAAEFDAPEAVRRLREPARAGHAIGEAVLDQRALAGIGNVFKSEVLFMERVDPFAPVGTLDEPTIERVVATARELLKSNARPGGRGRPHDDDRSEDRRAAGAVAAVGLRPRRPPVPPLRHAHRGRAAGHRAAAHHLLVPELPGAGRRRGGRQAQARARKRALASIGRPIIAPMCEQYVAISPTPFRLDALWPFTERLERFGIAGFGWGATWLQADGTLRSHRDIGTFRDDADAREIGPIETRAR